MASPVVMTGSGNRQRQPRGAPPGGGTGTGFNPAGEPTLGGQDPGSRMFFAMPAGTEFGTVGSSSSNGPGGFMPPVGGMPPQAPTPPPPNISATISPQLEALSGDWRQYVNDLREGTGHAMDMLGTKTRDAREGGRASLRAGNIAAGRPESAGMADFEGETQRQVQGTLADVALGREAMRGSALTGAGQAAEAPLRMALAEKTLGLNAYQAHQSAVSATNAANYANYNSAFNQMMALLEARRSSPSATQATTSTRTSIPGGWGSARRRY